MNGAHMHLVVNHVPVVLAVLAPLFLAWSLIRGGSQVRRLAMALTVMVGLAAVPAYLSGEPAEEIVEGLPGISEALIEPHEEAATTALVAAIVLGSAALIALIYFRKATTVSAGVISGLLVASLICAGLMGWTANLGGQIHHTEIGTVHVAHGEH